MRLRKLIRSFHTELLAHSVIVVQHVLERRHVELVVILRVLPEGNRCVLVYDAADLSDHALRQLVVVPVPDYLNLFACSRVSIIFITYLRQSS